MPDTFTKFDPLAFLEAEEYRATDAKVAKAANPPDRLATLATLAGSRPLCDSAATVAGGRYSLPARSLSATPAACGEAQKVRAAIVEFGGVAPREWAEGFARLDCARPPADVPPSRWRQFIDDADRFLDDGWPAQAAALGWKQLDLFGCDRHRPFARVDQQGLLWLLNGRRLVALTADTAIMETRDGGRVVYHRAPSGPGQVLVRATRRSAIRGPKRRHL
jgi:hypothetical protein